MVTLHYVVYDKQGREVPKVKEFASEKKMEAFIKRIEKKDNFGYVQYWQ